MSACDDPSIERAPCAERRGEGSARGDLQGSRGSIMSRPADEGLADRIEKLAARVAKVGPQMEAMVKEKQGDNPDFAFLSGGDGAEYSAERHWLLARDQQSA